MGVPASRMYRLVTAGSTGDVDFGGLFWNGSNLFLIPKNQSGGGGRNYEIIDLNTGEETWHGTLHPIQNYHTVNGASWVAGKILVVLDAGDETRITLIEPGSGIEFCSWWSDSVPPAERGGTVCFGWEEGGIYYVWYSSPSSKLVNLTCDAAGNKLGRDDWAMSEIPAGMAYDTTGGQHCVVYLLKSGKVKWLIKPTGSGLTKKLGDFIKEFGASGAGNATGIAFRQPGGAFPNGAVYVLKDRILLEYTLEPFSDLSFVNGNTVRDVKLTGPGGELGNYILNPSNRSGVVFTAQAKDMWGKDIHGSSIGEASVVCVRPKVDPISGLKMPRMDFWESGEWSHGMANVAFDSHGQAMIKLRSHESTGFSGLDKIFALFHVEDCPGD